MYDSLSRGCECTRQPAVLSIVPLGVSCKLSRCTRPYSRVRWMANEEGGRVALAGECAFEGTERAPDTIGCLRRSHFLPVGIVLDDICVEGRDVLLVETDIDAFSLL